MLASVPPLYYDISDHIIGSDKRFWFMDFKQQYCDASDFWCCFFSVQTNLAEPGGTFRRELSQTVITTYNLFHEKQMSIVSIVKLTWFSLSCAVIQTKVSEPKNFCWMAGPKKKFLWAGFEDQFP